MAYGEFKELARRTASDKLLGNKAFNITENSKYDGYQRGLASKFYKFFDKKSSSLADKPASKGSGFDIKQNEKLAEKMRKPIIKKFKKGRMHSSFKGKIWGADLADIQLISKFNKGIRFLLCIIDIF